MNLLNLILDDLDRYLELSRFTKNKTSQKFVKFKYFISHRYIPVFLIRLSQYFYLKKLKIISKFCSCINFHLFGLEVSSSIVIGGGLCIPHPQGVVIGAKSIGSNLLIFQNVTIGAKSFDNPISINSRPILEDNVTLGAGSKILGPIVVGEGAFIGANSVVYKDLPANSKYLGFGK